MDNSWHINVRLGWILGLAIAVVLIAATVGLVVTALITPLSIIVFLIGIAACITLGLAVRVLYQLWGLVNGSYELDRNALTINWGPVAHQIPMRSVREVLSGSKLTNLHVRPGLRWPGCYMGLGRATLHHDAEEEGAATVVEIDPIVFYATTRPRNHIIIRTDAITYAISPADLEEFLKALHERLEMGPTQEVEQQSTRPAFLEWAIWRDRWAISMLSGALLALVLLVGVLTWRFPYLPPEVALRFTSGGEPALIGPPTRVFYFAMLGAMFTLINGVAGVLSYRRERPLAYFLWSGLLATLASLWAAVISILLLNSS